MLDIIKNVYGNAYQASHEAGLQAVWDAACEFTRYQITNSTAPVAAEVVAVEQVIEGEAPAPEAPAPEAPAPEAPAPEAPAPEAPAPEAKP
jgi:hypothetical protein